MSRQSFKKYLFPGLLLFAALSVLFRPEKAEELLSLILSAAAPFITGILLAAVTDPAVCRFEGFFSRHMSGGHARAAAIFTVYLLIAGVAAAAAGLILPKLWESAALFVNSVDGYYSDFRRRYESGAANAPLLVRTLDSIIEQLSGRLPKLFDRTFEVTADFLKGAASFLVGAVLSVYILAQKDSLLDFISSAAKAALSERTYKKAARVIHAVNSCLVSFIAGQLTEAVVLGTLCFIGMVLLGFEYPLLISAIIAVTALVPVAGAIAGAIPSALILFLAKPSSALWFLVFIIILQQLENNFIYPKVVGKSVGMPPILILTAIIAGAELWGAAGIMLGIPLLSAAYTLIKERIEQGREGNRDMPS